MTHKQYGKNAGLKLIEPGNKPSATFPRISRLAQITAIGILVLIHPLLEGCNYNKPTAMEIIRDNRPTAERIDAAKRLTQDKKAASFFRMEAIEALGEMGDANTVPVLIEALKDEDEGVRLDAARALGKIMDARAISALTEALKDEDEGVRTNAAEALGRMR